jgi:hypothetical protein
MTRKIEAIVPEWDVTEMSASRCECCLGKCSPTQVHTGSISCHELIKRLSRADILLGMSLSMVWRPEGVFFCESILKV